MSTIISNGVDAINRTVVDVDDDEDNNEALHSVNGNDTTTSRELSPCWNICFGKQVTTLVPLNIIFKSKRTKCDYCKSEISHHGHNNRVE